MSADVNIFEILVLAAVAAFIIYRLHSVLGRKTGHERPRSDPFSARDNASVEPRHTEEPVLKPAERQSSERPPITDFSHIAPAGSSLAAALAEINLADRTFDPDNFLSGAKSAYEVIITAFAAGDRKELRPLLDRDVYESFDAAITDREERGETRELTLVGIQKAAISDAAFTDHIAEITVTFVSEQITVTKNRDGAVIEGDPTFVRQVTDKWTFARDTRGSDPNWELVATSAG